MGSIGNCAAPVSTRNPALNVDQSIDRNTLQIRKRFDGKRKRVCRSRFKNFDVLDRRTEQLRAPKLALVVKISGANAGDTDFRAQGWKLPQVRVPHVHPNQLVTRTELDRWNSVS